MIALGLHLPSLNRRLFPLTGLLLLPALPLPSQPSDGPGAGTGIPFDTTGLPDVSQMTLRFTPLTEGERAAFEPVAEALHRLSGGRVELDFEAATQPQSPEEAEHRPESIPPCVTVVPVAPEAGSWNPPAVSLVEGGTHLPLAVFALKAHAQVLSHILLGQRMAHILAPDVYVMAVRPDRLGAGFELFRLSQDEAEEASLEPVGGGVWIRSVRVLSAGRASGPGRAFVMLDRWVTPTHVRLLVWSGPIHVGLVQRVCLQLDVYGVERPPDGEQRADTE